VAQYEPFPAQQKHAKLLIRPFSKAVCRPLLPVPHVTKLPRSLSVGWISGSPFSFPCHLSCDMADYCMAPRVVCRRAHVAPRICVRLIFRCICSGEACHSPALPPFFSAVQSAYMFTNAISRTLITRVNRHTGLEDQIRYCFVFVYVCI
jgi:hypothetical protein